MSTASELQIETLQGEAVQKLCALRRSKQDNPNVSKIYSRKAIEQAMLETFEITGGVTRLTLWANKNEANYEKFLDLLIKLAPRALAEKPGVGSGEITYISNVPQSALNQNHKPRDPVLIEQTAEGGNDPV